MNALNNMKIGVRIYLIAIILNILVIVIAGISILKMSNIGEALYDVAEIDIPLTKLLTEINSNQLIQDIYFEKALRYANITVSDKDEERKDRYHLAKENIFKYSQKVTLLMNKAKVIPQEAIKIREIVMNVPLYYVPFVPHYIRGFINRHGEPYTVFDLHALFEKQQLESSTFLISSFNNDQIAFLTTSVIEILKIPESEVHLITSTDEFDSFFLGALNSKGTEIFILNLQNIIGRLENDLDNV